MIRADASITDLLAIIEALAEQADARELLLELDNRLEAAIAESGPGHPLPDLSSSEPKYTR
jgi:hypothetical protein